MDDSLDQEVRQSVQRRQTDPREGKGQSTVMEETRVPQRPPTQQHWGKARVSGPEDGGQSVKS